MWVNKCLSFFLVPSWSSNTPFYPPKVLRTKECAPTPDSSIVFTLDSHLNLSRSLGARQCPSSFLSIPCIWPFTSVWPTNCLMVDYGNSSNIIVPSNFGSNCMTPSIFRFFGGKCYHTMIHLLIWGIKNPTIIWVQVFGWFGRSKSMLFFKKGEVNLPTLEFDTNISFLPCWGSSLKEPKWTNTPCKVSRMPTP